MSKKSEEVGALRLFGGYLVPNPAIFLTLLKGGGGGREVG